MHLRSFQPERFHRSVWDGCTKVSLEPPLSRLNSPTSQSFFIAEVLQPSVHVCDLLQQLHISLVLGAPELGAVLRVRSHVSSLEGANCCPRLPAMLLLMQPRTQLDFWAASARCQLMSNFSSTSIPRSFSLGLFSIHSSAACAGTGGCPEPDAAPCTWLS